MLTRKGRPLAKSASWSSGRCREGRHRYNAAALGWAERVDSPVRPGIARSHCAAAAADTARCCPLSREAVAQHNVRAGSPAPGAASLSARQEVTEVEAPVYFAPRQAQQGAQEDRVLPQVAAVQVCDGLEGVDAAHLQGRTRLRGSTPAFQSRRRESEAQRRPPAAGPRVELARICFPCTSPACQPLDLSRSHSPASNLGSKAKEMGKIKLFPTAEYSSKQPSDPVAPSDVKLCQRKPLFPFFRGPLFLGPLLSL